MVKAILIVAYLVAIAILWSHWMENDLLTLVIREVIE